MSLAPSDRPSLFRSTLMLTGVGLVTQLFGFLYRIVMARVVGAQVLGLYQLIMPAYAVAQSICISGLVVAVAVLAAESHARRNELGLRQMLTASLRGLCVLWLPIALVVILRSDWIARHLLGDGRTRLGLLLLLPVLWLTGVENLQKHYFYGIGSMHLPAGVEVGEQIIRSLSIIALLLVLAPGQEEWSVALIVVGLLIGEIFSSCALTLGRKRRERRLHPLPGQQMSPRKLHRRMLRIALPVSLTALVGNLMGAATSILIPKLLMVHGMAQEQAMGEFGVMLGMTLPLLMIPTAFINALALALLPRLSEERALNNTAAFRRTGEKAMLSVSYVVLPLIALIATLGADLGSLLFADDRVGSHILPLAAGVGASCYHSILVCMLNALGKQNQSAGVSLFCGALELLLTTILIPELGLTGFVIAFVATEVAAVLACLVLVWRSAGIRLSCYRCFSAPVLSSLLAGLVVNLGYRWSMDAGTPRHWAVLWGCGIGMAIYLAAMLAQGIHPLGVIRGR